MPKNQNVVLSNDPISLKQFQSPTCSISSSILFPARSLNNIPRWFHLLNRLTINAAVMKLVYQEQVRAETPPARSHWDIKIMLMVVQITNLVLWAILLHHQVAVPDKAVKPIPIIPAIPFTIAIDTIRCIILVNRLVFLDEVVLMGGRHFTICLIRLMNILLNRMQHINNMSIMDLLDNRDIREVMM